MAKLESPSTDLEQIAGGEDRPSKVNDLAGCHRGKEQGEHSNLNGSIQSMRQGDRLSF